MLKSHYEKQTVVEYLWMAQSSRAFFLIIGWSLLPENAQEPQIFPKEDHEQELLELIKSFGKDEVEQKCLEKFQTW